MERFGIILVLMTLLCNSCRVNKEKVDRQRKDEYQQSSVTSSVLWKQMGQEDSTSRYWYFLADSSFFFHPDKGLWAQSGKLGYIEHNSTKTASEGSVELHDNQVTTHTGLYTETKSKWADKRVGMWILLLLVTIIIGGYWIYKRALI